MSADLLDFDIQNDLTVFIFMLYSKLMHCCQNHCLFDTTNNSLLFLVKTTSTKGDDSYLALVELNKFVSVIYTK